MYGATNTRVVIVLVLYMDHDASSMSRLLSQIEFLSKALCLHPFYLAMIFVAAAKVDL